MGKDSDKNNTMLREIVTRLTFVFRVATSYTPLLPWTHPRHYLLKMGIVVFSLLIHFPRHFLLQKVSLKRDEYKSEISLLWQVSSAVAYFERCWRLERVGGTLRYVYCTGEGTEEQV